MEGALLTRELAWRYHEAERLNLLDLEIRDRVDEFDHDVTEIRCILAFKKGNALNVVKENRILLLEMHDLIVSDVFAYPKLVRNC